MKAKRIAAGVLAVSVLGSSAVFASDMNGTKEIRCKVGDNLTVGTYPEAAEETQKLIDNRPDVQRPVEDMNRGLTAVKTDNGVFVSWRWQGYESLDVKYNLYRNGVKLNDEPMSLTNYTDNDPIDGATYSVAPVENGTEGEKSEEVSVWTDGYKEIKLDKPADAELKDGSGSIGTYAPNDASAADLDGDGEYELVVKWEAIVRDASKQGYTNTTIIDAYELDGTRMWRIDMGDNIRSGPHDTQFIVADFDGDGKAEMSCRTADGTVAGDGTVIGDKDAHWYDQNDKESLNGKNLKGPLYNTVFDGETGAVIDSILYFPQSTGTYENDNKFNGTTWGIDSWGDDNGNRSERYLGGLACLDGVHMSYIQSRGYYNRTCIGAYHLENGKIVKDFEFDSNNYLDSEGNSLYSGQGYHNLSVADVDYDAKDEIVFGNLVLDNDGTPMYSTGFGHGDAQHVGDLVPENPGLEVYTCQEWTGSAYGFCMRDARTGNVLYGLKTETDNGRACTADIDPRYDGEEAWSAYGVLTAANGEVISTNYSMPANFAIYWDGDLGREIEDGNGVYKWDVQGQEINPIFKATGCHSINAAKSNPCLQADLFGDWREELIYPTDDNEHIRIYTSTTPTSYRIPTLMSDGQYRDSIGWQNVCYNQPPHLSYYLGYGTETVPIPQIQVTKADGTVLKNPDLANGAAWDIDDLYFGDTVELMLDSQTAFVNGAKMLVDNSSTDVKPYLDSEDRTMVPLRFVSEAFGAVVNYDEDTKRISISCDGKAIEMTVGSTSYTLDGTSMTMDTAPVISGDRTMVPVRFISEALGKNVDYYDGLIYISTLKGSLDAAAVTAEKDKITKTSVPVKTSEVPLDNYGDKSAALRVEIQEATWLEKPDYGVEEGQEETPKDASAVIDYDLTTGVTIPAGGVITIDNGSWAGVPAAVIAFGDDKVHKFRIDYSSNGTSWQIALADRVSDGESGLYEKFYFGVPLYPRYIRYVSMDDTETTISEFAQAKVE